MKRINKNYSLIILGFLITCNVLSQNLDDLKPYRILVKFENENFTSNTEFTEVRNIQSDRIKEILELYNVKTLRAVFRNRYDSDGILKITYSNSSELNNNMNCWQEIILTDFCKSKDIVQTLSNEEGVDIVLC